MLNSLATLELSLSGSYKSITEWLFCDTHRPTEEQTTTNSRGNRTFRFSGALRPNNLELQESWTKNRQEPSWPWPAFWCSSAWPATRQRLVRPAESRHCRCCATSSPLIREFRAKSIALATSRDNKLTRSTIRFPAQTT